MTNLALPSAARSINLILFLIKGRRHEKKIFQENSALQHLGPKIIHEPKNLKKNFGKNFFSKGKPHQNEKIDF